MFSGSIKVSMAEMQICKEPEKVYTLGLGSCIAVVLYDRLNKIAGMAHIMLPDSTLFEKKDNPAKFVDTAIDRLLEDVLAAGGSRGHIIAKMAGGAQMFSCNSSSRLFRIGMRNVEAAKKRLIELGIPLIGEDTGGTIGRTVEFDTATGELMIRSIGRAIKMI